MKKHLLLLAAGLLLLSCGKKPGEIDYSALTIPDTLTILDYNVENMFDLENNGTEYPEFVPGQCNWTREIQQIKVANIARVIADAGPDIAVLEEVENRAVAGQLQRELEKDKCALPYAAFGDRPNPTNTIPVILSRFPLLRPATWGMPREVKYYTRNLLRADVYLGRDTLVVFACHWPSKMNPESKRISAAGKMAAAIKQLRPGAEFIVAGDFNSNYNECEIVMFDKSDNAGGLTGINHVLHTVLSAPRSAVVYPDKATLGRTNGLEVLYDPWLDVPQSQRMSEVYKHRKETPDHILLARTLFDTGGLSYVDNSFTPFSDSGLLLSHGEPFAWQFGFHGSQRVHLGEGYSDHLPIMCKIRHGAFRAGRVDSAISLPRTPAAVGQVNDLDEWQCAMKGIALRRECGQSRPDSCAVRLEGLSGSVNGCAAFKSLRPRAAVNDNIAACTVSIRLKGEAMLDFRIKSSEEKWIYFNAPNFLPAKSGRFARFTSAAFKKIVFDLPTEYAGKQVMLELRVAKKSAVGLWVGEKK